MSLLLGTPRRAIRLAIWSALLVVGAFVIRPAAQASDPIATAHWVGTWTTAPVAQATTGPNSTGFSNQTLRQITKVSLGESELRLRLSNTFGTKAVVVGSVQVGLRDKGPSIKAGSSRTVTFGNSKSVTLWPGAVILSDPVRLDVPALAELATSIYLPDDVPASLPITFHNSARQTNYISRRAITHRPSRCRSTRRNSHGHFLTGIDVTAPREVGAVVVLGDSLTDGNISRPDTNSRWTDALSATLHAAGVRMGVMNQGTGGGRVLRDVVGDGRLAPIRSRRAGPAWSDAPRRAPRHQRLAPPVDRWLSGIRAGFGL